MRKERVISCEDVPFGRVFRCEANPSSIIHHCRKYNKPMMVDVNSPKGISCFIPVDPEKLRDVFLEGDEAMYSIDVLSRSVYVKGRVG